MAGSITGTLQFTLQRKTGTSAWSTIATSDSISINLADAAGSEEFAGNITVSFNAATLNWAVGAEYRILVTKTLTDSSTLTSISAAEGRVYSVSYA